MTKSEITNFITKFGFTKSTPHIRSGDEFTYICKQQTKYEVHCYHSRIIRNFEIDIWTNPNNIEDASAIIIKSNNNEFFFTNSGISFNNLDFHRTYNNNRNFKPTIKRLFLNKNNIIGKTISKQYSI